MTENKSEPLRIDLKEPLAGCYVLLDADQLDVGLLEDIQSDKWRDTLDSLARAIVGGELPHGTDRAGIRRLRLAQLFALLKGVDGAFAVPKS